MKRGSKWLALVVFWPLLALAETEESASSVDDWSDSWEAAHCPGALPPEEPPYISRMEHYSKTGEDEKRLEMEAKHGRYVECTVAIGGRAGMPIMAYDAYEISMEMGATGQAQMVTLEKILDEATETYDPSGPIYPILKELYEAGYTQEMVDMADANPDKARNVLVKEYFCDCLAIPVEEFD